MELVPKMEFAVGLHATTPVQPLAARHQRSNVLIRAITLGRLFQAFSLQSLRCHAWHSSTLHLRQVQDKKVF